MISSLILPQTIYSESAVTICIEDLVKTVFEATQYPVPQYLPSLVTQPFYENIHRNLPTYMSVYQLWCDYSEHLNAFWYGCHQSGIMGWWQQYKEQNYVGLPPPMEWVYDLVRYIADYVQTPEFSQPAIRRKNQLRANCKQIEAGYQRIMQQHSKVLVVRVDVGFKHINSPWVNVHDFFDYTNQLFDHLSYRRGVFEHMIGRVACREQGRDRGYHAHLGLCFNGHKRSGGWYIAQQTGVIWEELTDGMGSYHHMHSQKEKQKYIDRNLCGIGMLHRNNPQQYANGLRVLSYMARETKTDQYLRKKPKGCRAFSQHFDHS